MTRHRYLAAWIVGVLLIAGYFLAVALIQQHVGILPK